MKTVPLDPTAPTRSLRFGQRLAERLPPSLGSIRVRLTLLYSILLFGLASIVVGGIYTGLARSLDDQPVARKERQYVMVPVKDGIIGATVEFERIDPLVAFEREVNTRALEKLRQYSFGALGMLFIGSLGVGWFVADMVLRPIGRITGVARDINATDLSRRINLRGPNDELRDLADTFDQMIARLDLAFEGQRHFIQEASHELRNPLAVIRTNVDVVLDDPAATVDDHKEVGEVVQRAAERMSVLVDDLLLSARYESPAMRRELVDLGALCRSAATEFSAAAELKEIELGAKIYQGQELGQQAGSVCEVPTMADPAALRRAVANLLVNAIRHTPEHGQICVSTGCNGPWNWIAVQDTGSGVAPGDRERIFNRFWRGDGPSTRRDGRTGLGLTIVRQIAESHDGVVTLDSTPDAGSTFTMWLKVDDDSSDSQAFTPPSSAPSVLIALD
ncbi:MAG: HAMP domain-containing sensor histidine kinase [Acidimicrobiales bacterium]